MGRTHRAAPVALFAVPQHTWARREARSGTGCGWICALRPACRGARPDWPSVV